MKNSIIDQILLSCSQLSNVEKEELQAITSVAFSKLEEKSYSFPTENCAFMWDGFNFPNNGRRIYLICGDAYGNYYRIGGFSVVKSWAKDFLNSPIVDFAIFSDWMRKHKYLSFSVKDIKVTRPDGTDFTAHTFKNVTFS